MCTFGRSLCVGDESIDQQVRSCTLETELNWGLKNRNRFYTSLQQRIYEKKFHGLKRNKSARPWGRCVEKTLNLIKSSVSVQHWWTQTVSKQVEQRAEGKVSVQKTSNAPLSNLQPVHGTNTQIVEAHGWWRTGPMTNLKPQSFSHSWSFSPHTRSLQTFSPAQSNLSTGFPPSQLSQTNKQ